MVERPNLDALEREMADIKARVAALELPLHPSNPGSPMEPSLSLDEAKAVVATKTYPRVTEESIKAKIADVSYEVLPGFGTLCVIRMKNGWMSTGFSAPADPRNFDEAVGQRYAYDNAFKPLWQLEGYLLKSHIAEQADLGA